ncbi:ABC transporter substrate-binding protein [Jatrophihabitans sp. YIM 134969]
MPRSHRLRACAAVLLLATTLTACFGRTAPTPTDVDFTTTPSGTLRGWAFDSADDIGEARMADAADHLPGVSVRLDQTGFNAQKFTTRLASGDVPDVVQMDRQFVANYAAQRLIMPLDRCYDAGKVDPTERFYPNVTNDISYDGHIWGVPQFFQPPAIMLDERVLRAAGVSDDEIDTSRPDVLLGAIRKIYRSEGGNPTVLGLDPVASGQTNLWVLGLGGRLVDDQGRPTLDDPRNEYPLTVLKQITDAQGGYAKLKSYTDTFDAFGDDNPFVADQVGAQIVNQWYLNVVAPYAGEIDIHVVPFLDRGGEPVTVTGGQAFVIPARAKNPAAACAWALRLTSVDDWTAAADARAATLAEDGTANTGVFTGSPAADRAIREQHVRPTGSAGLDQGIAAFYDVADKGLTFGASPAGEAVQRDLANAVAAVCLGDKSPARALADAQRSSSQAYETATR